MMPDELPRTASEIESDRVEAVMARVSRTDLEAALVIMLNAARQAEGEQGWLDRHLRPVVCQQAQDRIDNVGAALIEQGIDRVVDLLGAEAVQILEEEA